MSNGVYVLVIAGITAVLLWAFRPITPFKIFGLLIFLAMMWYLREIVDFGRPLPSVPDVVPGVEIKP